MKRLIAQVSVAFLLLNSSSSFAQSLKIPAPSPTQTIKQNFGLSDITIEYSRPAAKGRVVFGDVVPFGKIWRTGANASTKITFGDTVMINDTKVNPGTYAIYSIPEKSSWTIMLYKDLTLGGNVADYKKENELMRFQVLVSQLNEKVESFTINVASVMPASAEIEFSWENTRVSFPVRTDIDARIMKNIQTAVVDDNRPYYQAANYYYENNKDIKQAYEWVTKATEKSPNAYWVWLLRSKIETKLRSYDDAQKSAHQVIDLAKKDNDDTYVKLGEKALNDAHPVK